jgi:hypothetical protein
VRLTLNHGRSSRLESYTSALDFCMVLIPLMERKWPILLLRVVDDYTLTLRFKITKVVAATF